MPLKPISNVEFVEYLGLPNEVITDIKASQPTTYVPAMNRFLSGMVDKLIYTNVESMSFTNPFARFKGRPVAYGTTIENTFVEVSQGRTYNPNNTDPFERNIPNVKSQYLTRNVELQYLITLYTDDVKKAVFGEEGLLDLSARLVGTNTTARELDEFYAWYALLDNSLNYANGFEQIDRGSTDAETAEKVTKIIANAVKDFALPKKVNNKANVRNASAKGDLVLVIKKDLRTTIDFDYLAGVYNLSKIDLLNNIIEIDDEYWGVGDDSNTKYDVGFDFALMDMRCFDVHDNLQDNGTIYNPGGKYTNHYQNHWLTMGFKTFHNAKAWKLKD